MTSTPSSKSAADRCPTCHRRLTRSASANRRYWLLLHLIAEEIKPGGVSYSAEQWHHYCKSRWIGCDDVKLPNGKVLTIPRSSAALDVTEFADYMTQVEAWAAERHVYLADLD
jgi:hypothetical protein